MMNLSYQHESVRLTGRWDMTDPAEAVTTTPGAYLEFAFEGTLAVARFDVITNAYPRLHLWIEIDGGDRVSAPIDSFMRIQTKKSGHHVCRIIYKGGQEQDRRWFAPLTGKVSFRGVQVEGIAALPEDNRPTIEFVGDSITEGVLIDMDFNSAGDPTITYVDQPRRLYQDDACATYAWLTAEALDLRPIVMGYGAVGTTHGGCGLVPAVGISYPYNFDQSPITRPEPDYVLINHGANDRNADMSVFSAKYRELLELIRKMNPHATIIALSAFCFRDDRTATFLKTVEEYAKVDDNFHYISSDGWIPLEPLHPLRDGHKEVAKNLIPLMKEIMKK